MRIGIIGPIATSDICHLLYEKNEALPHGYSGGPLLATLIEDLIKRGNEVSAFTLSKDLSLGYENIALAHGNNFRLHYVPMRPHAWRPNGWHLGRILDLYKLEINALCSAIRQAAPDVIHAHWTYEFALAALQSNTPVVITCHDSPYMIARLASTSRPTRSLYRWLRVLMARDVLKTAPCVTAVSPYMRDQIQGMTSSEIRIVPNMVDDLTTSLAEYRKAPVIPRIAMVCNGWDKRKNPEPGLRAFAALRTLIPMSELHLFGADFGPEQTAQRWCKKQGLDAGLVFHGAVPHRQLLDALAKLDLLLHTSIEESFGMVLAECMAMGIPVIAGKNSGAVPWVVGKSGSLCDITQPEEITKTMLETLEVNRYSELSENSIRSIQTRFSTTHVVDQFCDLYQQAITDKQRSTTLLTDAGISF